MPREKIYCKPDDCDNCPYPDCIGTFVTKKTPGRKKMNPEVVRQRRLAYQRVYYLEHKEKQQEWAREYYIKNKG